MKKKILNLPLLACLAGLVCCYAFGQRPVFSHSYGISSQNATGYVVAEEIDGETQGIDYDCGITRTAPCTVYSNGVYAAGATIPFANATILVASQSFVDLNPGQ